MNTKDIACFIRLKNQSLIDFLNNEIQVRHNDLDDMSKPWIAYNHGMWITVDKVMKSTPYTEHEVMGIDCGTDIELFKGLCAIREDSDYMQYFVSEKEERWVNLGMYSPKGSLYLSLVNKYDNEDYHKASPEELIQYFKENYFMEYAKPNYNLLDNEPEVEMFSPKGTSLGKTRNQLIFDDWRRQIKQRGETGYYFICDGNKYSIDYNGTPEENVFSTYTDILIDLL